MVGDHEAIHTELCREKARVKLLLESAAEAAAMTFATLFEPS